MPNESADTIQSGGPDLPGSETGAAKPNARDTNRSTLIAGILDASKPKQEQRSNAASTQGSDKPSQERESSVTDPQPSDVKADTEEPPVDVKTNPAEYYRREAQREKDLRYKLEADRAKEQGEREVYQEQQRLNQMSGIEQQALARFNADVQPMVEQAWELDAQAKDSRQRAANARAGGDDELADYLERQASISERSRDRISSSVNQQWNGFQGSLNNHRQQINTERMTQHEKQLARILKDDGLTIEDLRAVDPKLNINDNFAVIKATNKAINNKLKAELQAEKDKAKSVETEARAKWRTDSPSAAQPRGSAAGGRGTNTNQGAGSGRSLIAEGLKQIKR